MLSKFFESLYNKVFVNIVVKSTTSDVYVEMCSKKDVISHFEESFETTKLNQDMIDFISSFVKESPYYYISFLDPSKEQGAIPTCYKDDITQYYDISASEYKCSDGKWIYYTSKTNLYDMDKKYHEIGIDMVFSPFNVIANFFQDKIGTHLAMYVLVQEESLSLSIFEDSKLIFGDYIDMQTPLAEDDTLLGEDMEMEMEMDLGVEDTPNEVDLDEIHVSDEIEDIDDLEDFADIEDLDTIEDIDEFSKTQSEEIEEIEEVEEVEAVDEESFNEDYERFSFIQTSLGHFYDDKKYESKFIEHIYIADSVGVSDELKRYLEEEMFLNVYIRHLNLSIEVAALAKMEIEL